MQIDATPSITSSPASPRPESTFVNVYQDSSNTGPSTQTSQPPSGQTTNGHIVTVLSQQIRNANSNVKGKNICKCLCLSMAVALLVSAFTPGAYSVFDSEPHALSTNSSYISYKSSSTGIAPLPSSISASLTNSLSSTNHPLSSSFTSSSLFSSTGSQNTFKASSQSSSSSSTGANNTQNLSSSRSSSTGLSNSSSSSSSSTGVAPTELFSRAYATFTGTRDGDVGSYMGNLIFSDLGNGNTNVLWSLISLEEPKKYGMHIYADNAVCLPTGQLNWYYLHFNPYQSNHHGDRTNPLRHLGDLGNIEITANGYGSGSFNITQAQLSRQRSTGGIIDLIVVVEKDFDDFADMGEGSNIGPGLACGRITA